MMKNKTSLSWLATRFGEMDSLAKKSHTTGNPDQREFLDRYLYRRCVLESQCHGIRIPHENDLVNQAMKKIFTADPNKLLEAVSALGMPSKWVRYISEQGHMCCDILSFWDDKAKSLGVKPPDESTKRNVLLVCADVCREIEKQRAQEMIAQRQGKADRTRESVRGIIEPIMEKHPSVQRKTLIAAVVQAKVCKKRTAEKYINQLVKSGALQRTWRAKCFNPPKIKSQVLRQQAGRNGLKETNRES